MKEFIGRFTGDSLVQPVRKQGRQLPLPHQMPTITQVLWLGLQLIIILLSINLPINFSIITWQIDANWQTAIALTDRQIQQYYIIHIRRGLF